MGAGSYRAIITIAALVACGAASAHGAPGIRVAGIADEGRPLRAMATGGAILTVRWQRCARRACARPTIIGRDTGYRLTHREARAYVRAQVRMRMRAPRRIGTRTITRTVVRTLHSRWIGPIRPRTATRAPSTPATTEAGARPADSVTVGVDTSVRGENGARWDVTVLGHSPDATDFVQMVDPDAPRAASDERYVMARIRLVNTTRARHVASPAGLRLALGSATYTIAAVAEPERLATRDVDGGDAIEGTVYWRIPRMGTPMLVAAFATAPEWWRYFALN